VELIKKHGATEIGVMVIHNKKKEKRGKLSSDIKYFAGEDVEDTWIVYPWDALGRVIIIMFVLQL
jgi:hypothetical protein